MAENEKKLSKTEKRVMEAKKKARIERTITIVTFIAVIVILFLAIYFTKNKDNNTSGPSELVPEKDYTACREAYCKGLNDDGTIKGIDDIDAYVKLPDVSSIILYTKDFPLDYNDHRVEAGMHIIDCIVNDSQIIDYDPYVESLVGLYVFIYEDYYKTYKEAYDNKPEAQVWANMYDFLGISEKEYFELVKRNAVNDMRHYLVVQALNKKFGIKATDVETDEYAVYQDFRAQEKGNAETTKKHYGEAYVSQRADEYVLALKLLDEVKQVDGSITDNWESKKDIYSDKLYDNGRIKGIGDITDYCKLTELDKDKDYGFKNVDDMILYYLDNSEFKEYDSNDNSSPAFNEYFESVRAIMKNEGLSCDDDAVYVQVKEDLVYQSLFDKYKLQLDKYKTKYLARQTYEQKMEDSFVYGDNYVNKTIIKYAVMTYLDLTYFSE